LGVGVEVRVRVMKWKEKKRDERMQDKKVVPMEKDMSQSREAGRKQ
jgi:hypothetical protein